MNKRKQQLKMIPPELVTVGTICVVAEHDDTQVYYVSGLCNGGVKLSYMVAGETSTGTILSEVSGGHYPKAGLYQPTGTQLANALKQAWGLW